MRNNGRLLGAVFTAALLIAGTGTALAQSDKERAHGNAHDKGTTKAGHGSEKAKAHKHVSGKDLLGAKINQNGNHKLQDHGKFSAFANVSGGKITGVSVTHAEKGDIPVTKYKSAKKMAQAPGQSGIYLVQYESPSGTYIGYAYIDDYGDEIIYWFPIEMIADGNAGAVEYVEYY